MFGQTRDSSQTSKSLAVSCTAEVDSSDVRIGGTLLNKRKLHILPSQEQPSCDNIIMPSSARTGMTLSDRPNKVPQSMSSSYSQTQAPSSKSHSAPLMTSQTAVVSPLKVSGLMTRLILSCIVKKSPSSANMELSGFSMSCGKLLTIARSIGTPDVMHEGFAGASHLPSIVSVISKPGHSSWQRSTHLCDNIHATFPS